MALFMIGYVTTTSFGQYFFKYAYGNEDMYPVFAGLLGVSQILALLFFPLISKKMERAKFYLLSTILVILGYVVFFIAPVTNMAFIGLAGVLLFVGEAFIQLLMLMFLADAVEYGFWKLGKRNDSITFAIQPFINKIGGAIGSGVVSVTIIISGIKDAKSAVDVTTTGLWIMKSAMLLFPLICIVIGYFIYRFKYRIDQTLYNRIIEELRERGDYIDEDFETPDR
jgi:Na+/melibiose symporter-like transporter